MNNLEDADTKERTAWRESRTMIDIGVSFTELIASVKPAFEEANS